MPKSKSIYRRLPGRGATLTYYAHLYQGPDHLLQSSSSGYSETYKRFYFRDIQAIIIRKTNLWLVWFLVWLLPALLCALIALTAPASAGFWVVTGVFALGGLINLLLGPSCTCHVQTAVQTERLPSLKRFGKARKILAQLKPLLDAVQGKLPAEDQRSEAAAGAPSGEMPPRQQDGSDAGASSQGASPISTAPVAPELPSSGLPGETSSGST